MTNLQKSHVRQHYIPQFILKNFCYDQNKSKVYFFENGESEYSSLYVSDVFMEKYFYSKEENSLKTEESLARFEADVAPIFKKLKNDTEINLSFEEDERLRIFLSLLAFRTVGTKEQFKNMSEASKELYRKASNDINMEDIWLNNVHLISKCRKINEIINNSEINNLIKLFIVEEFSQFYMCVLESRGLVDFIISDCYPVVMEGEGLLPNSKQPPVPIYYFYPISQNRLIVLVTNYIKDVPRSVANLDCDRTLKGPSKSSDIKHLLFRPAKLYQHDVEWINEMIKKNAKVGVIVKDLERCSKYV